MGDVAAAVVDGAHMMAHLAVASEGTAVEEEHSTFVDFAVTAKLARHTSGADRVLKEMQQRLESSIAVCGKWEGMKVASSEWQP